jgi:hypothetical protein
MDSSVSPKDEIWFLRVCHDILNAVYLLNKRWTLGGLLTLSAGFGEDTNLAFLPRIGKQVFGFELKPLQCCNPYCTVVGTVSWKFRMVVAAANKHSKRIEQGLACFLSFG